MRSTVVAGVLGLFIMSACGGGEDLSGADLDTLVERAAGGDAQAMAELEKRTQRTASELDKALESDDPETAFQKALHSGQAGAVEALSDVGNAYALTHLAAAISLQNDITDTDKSRGRLLLEPRVQLVASLADQNPAGIINEDSQSIEFDYAGLFDYNKSTGFDAFEDGQRANVGLIASADWNNGLTIDGSIGQQFRVQSTEAFDRSTGLGGETSDIVGSLNIRYRNVVGLENRFRIEDGFGSLQRAESMFFLRAGPVRSALSYVRLNEENTANNLIQREELTAQGNLKLTDHWSVGAAWRLDLEGNRTVTQDFIVGYEDECSTFGVTYRRDRTRTNNLEPDNAILLTFSLKSLVEQ